MTPADRGDTRLVYSSGSGRIQQGRRLPERSAPAGDGIVRVSRTKAGRKGKTVTLVTGLPPGDVAGVAKELKRLLGTGGAAKDGEVEIQGDHRDRVAEHLGGRYRVKLAGG
jgi:translation initiation factor 1